MVRVRCMSRDMSVLRFCLAMSGQPLVARKRSTPRVMSVLRFGLAKADQPVMVRVRQAPKGMFVFRFALATGGQLWWPEYDGHPGACPFYAFAWPREASP